ncbi:hypothetical protein WG947_07625 [Pontibacter sp. H259]|uniref:hypothetical protein n=1 Tax=Pontibacter sp. H259 TaxID=3133421 RepID=UPI0030C0AD95
MLVGNYPCDIGLEQMAVVNRTTNFLSDVSFAEKVHKTPYEEESDHTFLGAEEWRSLAV